MKTSDIDILRHILRYCNQINILVKRFGKDLEIFKSDIAYKDSVSMNLLQIGEMVGHLSEDFRTETNDKIKWLAIKGMCNLFAHNYGAMDTTIIWNTVIEKIPELSTFCDEIVKYHE